jgi:ribose 5-phosphate isomerase B
MMRVNITTTTNLNLTNKSMKIFIGADHQGFSLRNELIDMLTRSGYEVVDEGDKELNPDDDFPQFAARTSRALLASNDKDDKAILICGSGQGMAMAANRFSGIRASLVFDAQSAHDARNDDDSNVLCLPASILKTERAKAIVHTWLTTPFAAASRYQRRIKELDDLAK